ncbi:MAG TPA: VOC family protein [Solirubrobacteraceae bacterium]
MGARTDYSSGTFCWADLATPDVQSAKAFYGGVLGWEFEGMNSGDAPDYVIARRYGARVAALHEATDQPPHWNNYVAVEDADLVAHRAQELGGTVFAGPFDVSSAGRMAAISDPQGAMVIAWKPAELVGAEVVNEPGAMTWNDLLTSDVEGAREFYSALFGWSVTPVPESGGRYWVIKGPDGSNGGMMPLPTEDIPPFWQPYFAVESLETAQAKVHDLGGRLLTEPMAVPSGAFVAVLDPQGAAFSLLAGDLEP